MSSFPPSPVVLQFSCGRVCPLHATLMPLGKSDSRCFPPENSAWTSRPVRVSLSRSVPDTDWLTQQILLSHFSTRETVCGSCCNIARVLDQGSHVEVARVGFFLKQRFQNWRLISQVEVTQGRRCGGRLHCARRVQRRPRHCCETQQEPGISSGLASLAVEEWS